MCLECLKYLSIITPRTTNIPPASERIDADNIINIQVDYGFSPIFGILGCFNGSDHVCPTSHFNTATSFYCSLLWLDRIDIILRH